jgi:predicted DNA-binding transcriptional regulator AlpA
MSIFSTRQAAKTLGINPGTLSRYISQKKVPAPKTVRFGNLKVHAWSQKDIDTRNEERETRSSKQTSGQRPVLDTPSVP